MPAFTFVLKKSGSDWKATRVSSEEPELSAEAGSTYELQKALKSLAIENSSGGGVAVLFSTISPDAAIYQINIGGAVAAGGGGGGGGGTAAAGGAADAPAAKEEAKKEEEEEESGDDDMGFSLFD